MKGANRRGSNGGALVCKVKGSIHAKVIHFPRLDTVLEIEETIMNAKEYPNKRQLWLSLKKKIMYQTFMLILNYLEYSGKIYITKDGKVMWIYDPEFVEKAIKQGLVVK